MRNNFYRGNDEQGIGKPRDIRIMGADIGSGADNQEGDGDKKKNDREFTHEDSNSCKDNAGKQRCMNAQLPENNIIRKRTECKRDNDRKKIVCRNAHLSSAVGYPIPSFFFASGLIIVGSHFGSQTNRTSAS